jgi:hypothetical protein
MIVLNLVRCREVATILQRMEFPRQFVQQQVFCSRRQIVGNFNLMLVAICHQTQNTMGVVDGQEYRGWDYLQRKLNAHCQSNPDFLDIQNWTTLSAEELDSALAPAQSTLAFLDGKKRTALINDLGRHMIRAGYSSFEQLYNSSNGRCCGEWSIISFLKVTEAYSDTNGKKARLLIGLLRDAHGWEFADAHELGPPVDYHEIRGHLRIGTVSVEDSGLRSRIQSDTVSNDDDHAIRAVISEAVVAISRDLPDTDPLRVHYVLWKYFRTLC